MSDNEVKEPSQGRPGWVWAISLWKAFGLAFGILSLALSYSGGISLGDAAQTMSRLTPIDHAMTALLLVLNAASIWLLFTLDRRAPPLLTATLIVNIAYSIAFYVLRPSAPLNAGLLVGWGIESAICVYAWRLRRAGVLR